MIRKIVLSAMIFVGLAIAAPRKASFFFSHTNANTAEVVTRWKALNTGVDIIGGVPCIVRGVHGLCYRHPFDVPTTSRIKAALDTLCVYSPDSIIVITDTHEE